jgi:DNA-binding NarL/FixJ family response regulator
MQANNTSNPSGKIRVLLVDDEPLAIEGWKELLLRAKDFEVIGNIELEDFPKKLTSLPSFEIVLSSKTLLNPSNNDLIELLKKSGPRV